MKKKFFAALCAAVVAICGLCAPVSAESAYKKGDVTMDGKIDLEDVCVMMRAYIMAGLIGLPAELDEEQMQLGSITGAETNDYPGCYLPFDIVDAQVVLTYYVYDSVMQADVPKDMMEFYHTVFQKPLPKV